MVSPSCGVYRKGDTMSMVSPSRCPLGHQGAAPEPYWKGDTMMHGVPVLIGLVTRVHFPTMPNPIALAIPFFFLLMGVEIFFARRRGLKVYRFSDAIVDLSCGMTQQILLVFSVGVLVGGYTWLYQHRLFDFQKGSLWPWVIAFIGVDLVYYWWHRLSHEVNVLCAVHMVHHQSEDYNLAVALRQAVLSVWTIWPLHLPLALLGVPPVVFLVVDSLSTLCQFWIHTELIGKLGWYEWIFNTPSQHR